MASLKIISSALILIIVSSLAVQARTSLVALPQRDAVTINMGNPLATLVEETRVLTLQKGTNKIDFSWQGVHIDPSSIQITILSHQEQVRILSVSFPPGQEALTWDVYSENPLEADIRIGYLLSGIDRLVTYEALTGPDEKTLDLKSYLVLRNFSGEDFDMASFLLNYGQPFSSQIRHEETKRILFLEKKNLPIEKIFTWDASLMPHEPDKMDNTVGIPVTYSIRNNQRSGLGEHSFWAGKARIYQEDGHNSTIFLGEDHSKATPVDGKMAFYIGDSRDISVSQYRLETIRTNIRNNKHGALQAYDEKITDRITVKNFKDKPVTLTIIENIQGEWEPIEFSSKYTLDDNSALTFLIEVPAHETREILMAYTIKNIFASTFNEFNRVMQ